MPLAECWGFFSDPKNLSRITPPELNFKVISSLPARIYPGLMIKYKVSPLFGISLSWLTEITQVEAERFFVDEQRLGPYKIWHHEHSFAPIDDRTTRVNDCITYVPPLGPLGALLNRFFIAPQLKRIFDFREETLRGLGSSP